MNTQNQEILAYLQSGNSISQAQAIDLFGCYRLGARIFDLRKKGHDITTENVTKKNRHGKPVTFAVYKLAEVSA